MIGYVRGAVTHLFTDYCFIDVQGVGYRVFIAGSTRQKLVLGTVASLFTYLQVREDALLLYGFYTQDEYELFLQLLSVTGIGPKVALGVLSAISPNDFRRAVSQKNMIILTKLPGIGKKTAERLILELKDKIGIITESEGTDDFVSDETSIASEVAAQGLQALLSLGYSQSEIGPVLQKIGNTQTVEELIKLALKEFSRR
jgi:Holliday junction DNA helicase RuvA